MTKKMAGSDLTRKQVNKLIAQSKDWMATSEGRATLQKVAISGTPIADRLRDAQKIDQASLLEPLD